MTFRSKEIARTCTKMNNVLQTKNYKRPTSRRAQVQMGEAIMVVVIVIILIVFGFVFYTRWAESNIKSQSGASREEDAYAVATVASNLPELHCSEMNVVSITCYDTLRIAALKTVIEDSKRGSNAGGVVSKEAFFYYSSLFKNSNITVYEIYPSYAPDVACWPGDDCVPPIPALNWSEPLYYTIYDNPPDKITQRIPARIPITLYDPLTEKEKFGIIEVVRYY
jgi:hypothetical protein